MRIFTIFLTDHVNLWSSILLTGGLLSILVASVAAIYQKRLKRLLAYSAISHVGFMLVAFCCNSMHSMSAVLVYIVLYIIMSVGVFSLILNSTVNSFLLKYLIN